MNVTFTWETVCHTTVVIQNQILPNIYRIKLHFVTSTENVEEQRVSFEEVKMFFDQRVNLCSITCYETPEFDILKEYFEHTIMQIPGSEFSDLDVGYCLSRKVQKIIRKNLLLIGLEISSQLGDNIEYILTPEDKVANSNATWTDLKPWWDRPDFDINDLNKVDLDLTHVTQESKPERKPFVPVVIDGGKKD